MVRSVAVTTLLVATLAVSLLAGCTQGPYAADLAPVAPAEDDKDPVLRWRFGAGGDAVLPLDGVAEALPTYRLTGYAGAEPNIGVAASGRVFVSAYDDVVRSTDLRDWTSVLSFDPLLGDGGDSDTADPMLWVDGITDRVYSSHMFPGLVCMAVSWSEDEGETWTSNEESCTLPGLDHQKFMTAPPGPLAPSIAGDAHPTVLYQCYQKVVGTDETGMLASGFATACNMSYDGGSSWPAETIATARVPGGPGCGGINGHPAAAPDGTVVVPLTRGCDGLYLAVSLDSGLTWTTRPGPTSVGAESIDPDITFTPDGTLYALWRGSDQLPYLARSSDVGLSWEGPWRVGPPGVTSTVFQAIGSGADGEVAFAFLGTDDTDAEPSRADNETRWHMYIGITTDAAAPVPTLDVVQVTQEDDPVQIGCVWLYGGGHPCRNMLDFIDATVTPDGRFLVAFTKGCGGCASSDDKTSDVAVAWLDHLRLQGP